jgi:hypothetical protein
MGTNYAEVSSNSDDSVHGAHFLHTAAGIARTASKVSV